MFRVQVQVFASQIGEHMDQRASVLESRGETETRVINGKIQAEFNVSQKLRANQSNLELLIKVEPIGLNANRRFAAFSGLYRLGPATQLESGGAPIANVCVQDPSACDFDKIEKEVAEAGAAQSLQENGSRYLFPNSRYLFSNLTLRFLMVEAGETATQRTVAYTASTCITDRITGRPLADTWLNIAYEMPENKPEFPEPDVEVKTLRKQTDQSGCLRWDGRVFHRYYQPEKYVKRVLYIEKRRDSKRSSPTT
ncbi:MAG: hypothetical protein HC902_02555 [Calothrix sp. SM1_5_4]|nr:hypothetical protein [Calothrix sp. SM1_5_4]